MKPNESFFIIRIPFLNTRFFEKHGVIITSLILTLISPLPMEINYLTIVICKIPINRKKIKINFSLPNRHPSTPQPVIMQTVDVNQILSDYANKKFKHIEELINDNTKKGHYRYDNNNNENESIMNKTYLIFTPLSFLFLM